MVANAFFVATEFALTRIPQFEKADFQDSPGLRRAWEMTERLEIYLTGCQLGITTTSILLGIVAEPAVTILLQPIVSLLPLDNETTSIISIVVAVIFINLIHKIWGEQAPTYLGVEKPKEVARLAAPIHYWWTTLTYPFILFGDGVAKKTLNLFGVSITRSWTDSDAGENGDPGVGTRTELKRQMATLLRTRDLSFERRQEVMNALTIGERPVREIMIPREQIVALSTQNALQENLRIATDHAHSRFPLVHGSLEDVAGTIYGPVLLRNWDTIRDGTTTLEDVAASPVVVPAAATISQLIDYFQEREQELTLVEENDDIVGLITITDAFEAIAGDVKDPLDESARVSSL